MTFSVSDRLKTAGVVLPFLHLVQELGRVFLIHHFLKHVEAHLLFCLKHRWDQNSVLHHCGFGFSAGSNLMTICPFRDRKSLRCLPECTRGISCVPVCTFLHICHREWVFGMLRSFLCISFMSHVTNSEYPPSALWDWLSFHCACQRLTQAWVHSHCKGTDTGGVPAWARTGA